MVKKRRREIAILAALLAVGAWVWLRGWGGQGGTGIPGVGGSDKDAPLSIDDVPRIGLDRLAKLQAANQKATDEEEEDGELGAGVGGRRGALPAMSPPPATPDPAPTAPPAPTDTPPPPMNVRYIGAVEVRSGVWVASLLNDRKDLLTGKEGDIIGNRYRIVKIGIESIDLLETSTGRQRRVKLGGS